MADGAPAFEDHGWLTIRRLPLPPHRSGALDQARAFLAFAPGVLRATRGGEWDAVFATSSRLMTAALGAEVARRARAPLYLDIRDLFADTMGDLLSGSPLRALLPVFRQIEKWTLRRADRVNLVSAGFLEHVSRVAPEHQYRLFTNGIDDAFLSEDFERTDGGDAAVSLVVYAGNIGDGQGLHRILPEAAARLDGRARFRVVGDGGRRAALDAALESRGISNVERLPPVARARLNEHYREADILFLHLNDHDAFRKVLPSKIFEYAATGKPILAGVAGHAANFLRREVPGAAVFAPCDAEGMVRAFDQLGMLGARIDRPAFRETYARRAIMERMAADLIDLAKS
jgi:glycosyltransferase involved in cell wall biosynthesis